MGLRITMRIYFKPTAARGKAVWPKNPAESEDGDIDNYLVAREEEKRGISSCECQDNILRIVLSAPQLLINLPRHRNDICCLLH